MATVDLSTNFLAMESEFIDRLKSVSGLEERGGAYEFDLMQSNGSPVPSAYVLYGGHATGDKRDDARVIEQMWQVVLTARPEQSSKEGSLANAGVLLSRLINAFEGWKPTGCLVPLEDASTDEPVVIYANGLVQFVQTYRARVRLG